MTGTELRQSVCNIINSWVGGVKGGASHKEIIQIWNSGKDAGQYTMSMSDPYCAATVSAAWIKAGIAAYTGKEVSCPRFITVAKNKGIWVENDAYKPQIGDAVLYDWSDGSNYAGYDNTTAPDHIGLVTKVSGNTFVVTEGNMSGGKIGTWNMVVNGRYIRGFICPDYDAIAAKLGGSAGVATPVKAKTTKMFGSPKTWKNGSTSEPVYADTGLTIKIGSLDPRESCPCLGIVNDRCLVYYPVDGTTEYKAGYVEYAGGITA